MGSILSQLDQGFAGLLGQWNSYSTALAGALAAIVAYRVATAAGEPDVHPMRLARQAMASMVRQEGESARYRSADLGGAGDLRTGLEVRDKGASRWSRGRDGDLRDVWRRVVEGTEEGIHGVKPGMRGKLRTILGSENVLDHDIDAITRQINLIGHHISEQGGIRVAIYLPNSIEFLVTLFACAFYPNLTTVLIPFDVTPWELISMLRRSASDTVVAAPGTFPVDAVAEAYPALRNLIWVVDEGASHMDWSEVPEGTGGRVNVATWQEIINDAPADAGRELPSADKAATASASASASGPRDVVTFWQQPQGKPEHYMPPVYEMVRFTQQNLVAGIAGLLGHLAAPGGSTTRMGPEDVFLPTERLTQSSTLALTLAALHCNATVALNSVAGPEADVVFAAQGISPTVLAATPEGLARIHDEAMSRLRGGSAATRAAHRSLCRTLERDGVLPSSGSLAARFNSGLNPGIGVDPTKLRLVFVADRATSSAAAAGSPKLSSRMLSDLRVILGARVVYALAAAKVAGVATMGWVHDYRNHGDEVVVGPPTVSCEITLKDTADVKTSDETVQGEIVVRGPCVAGGEAAIGVIGRMRRDHTLAYI